MLKKQTEDLNYYLGCSIRTNNNQIMWLLILISAHDFIAVSYI